MPASARLCAPPEIIKIDEARSLFGGADARAESVGRALRTGSKEQLLLPGGLGEGFPAERIALSLVQMPAARASSRTGVLSHLGRSTSIHGVGEVLTRLGTGWLGLGEGSGVIRQWEGKLGPQVMTGKPLVAFEQGEG